MSGFNKAEFKNAHSYRRLAKSKIKPIRKVKHLIRFIQEDRWYLDRIKGSHRHFKHSIKPGIVTVPKQLNADLRLLGPSTVPLNRQDSRTEVVKRMQYRCHL